MNEQFSRHAKPASGDRTPKKQKASRPATAALQGGDRVKFGDCCGSVVKSDLFSNDDPIEFILFDNSRAQPVPIDRRFLEFLSHSLEEF